MADAETPLNIQQDEVQVIQPPARSVPGGGVQQMDGPIRSIPGGETKQLGGDIRQGANQKQGAPADADVDGTSTPPPRGDPADPAGQREGEPEGGAGAEGAEAAGAPNEALAAALAELPEETRAAFKPFEDSFAANGTLTPEEVTGAAAALGVPEALVKFHLAAVQAATPAEAAQADPVQAELVSVAYEVAGGAEAYKPFRDWLKAEGRTEDEQLLGDAIEAKSPAMLKRLMAPLVAEYKASGAAPNTRRDITSEAAQGEADTGAVEGFSTQAEMIDAQRVPDPKNPRKTRYASDPEYRAQVNKRIAVSDFSQGKQR